MIKFASKVDHTRHMLMKPPDARKKEIDFKVRNMGWQNDPTLKRFGMTIQTQMVSLPARILPHPKLAGASDMGGGAFFEPKSGKWDLRGYRLKNVYPTIYLRSPNI
jgi:eukaryotic translation initiation factor 2C